MTPSEIMATILDKASINALLSNYDSRKTIYEDVLIPKDVPATYTTINYYVSGTVDEGVDFYQAEWSINCRAESYSKSNILAQTVSNEINRISGDGFSSTVIFFPTISPADDTDNYNTPLQVTLKTRRF